VKLSTVTTSATIWPIEPREAGEAYTAKECRNRIGSVLDHSKRKAVCVQPLTCESEMDWREIVQCVHLFTYLISPVAQYVLSSRWNNGNPYKT
jgi:hypothetical protein